MVPLLVLRRGEKQLETNVVVDCVLGLNGLGTPLEWLPILRGELRTRELVAISKTVTCNPITAWPWEPFLRVRSLGNDNWVNAYGLLNPGRDQAPELLQRFIERTKSAIISIFAENTSEAIGLGHMISSLSGAAAAELNCSCPNIHELSVDQIVANVDAFRRVCRLPVLIKLGFDQDYVEIARQLRSIADGLHVINTVRWETHFPERVSPLARYGGGGISGPIIHEYALRCVSGLREAGIEMPILAGGGVNSTNSARLLIEAGADAVAVATAIHHHPNLPHQLEEYLELVPFTQREQSSP